LGNNDLAPKALGYLSDTVPMERPSAMDEIAQVSPTGKLAPSESARRHRLDRRLADPDFGGSKRRRRPRAARPGQV
jgi:hypothetical protein